MTGPDTLAEIRERNRLCLDCLDAGLPVDDAWAADDRRTLLAALDEVQTLNREHLKTIARDDVRLAELHDAKVDLGTKCNRQAERIAKLEATLDGANANIRLHVKGHVKCSEKRAALKAALQELVSDCDEVGTPGLVYDETRELLK